MTQTVTLPNGDTIDFPDDMPPDALNNAVSRHMAATNSAATAPSGNFYDRNIAPYIPPLHAPLDAQGQPVQTPISQGTQLIGDVAMHANPLALANAAFVATQHGLNAAFGQNKDVFSPLDYAAEKGHLTVDPNAGPAMKTAHEVGPWLVPSGNQLGRIGEAAGPFNRATTFLRSEGANVIDWAASDAFQKMAEQQGWGPLAQMIAGAVGGNTRQVVARAGATQVPKVIPPQPGAGEKVDVSKALLPAPGARGISDRGPGIVPPFQDVADPNSSGARFVSGAGAIPFSGTGESGAVKAQTQAIARTADAGLQGLDPSVTPVTEAGPASLKAKGSEIATEARAKIQDEEIRLKAESDRVEGQIGDSTRVDATALRNKALQIATNEEFAPAIRQAAENAFNDIEKAVDSASGTVTFGALKGLRSTFGRAVDDLYQASSGKRSGKNQVARAIFPIEDAMSATMQDAANQNGVGREWGTVDADWRTHSAVKRSLADVAGVLKADVSGFKPAPGGKAAAKTLNEGIQGGEEGLAPIIDIEQGLGERQARSGVAETVAAMGTPKKAESDYAFQPSTFGKGVKNIDKEAMDYIEAKAGPEARMNLENAAEAGAGTSQPPKQGGLRRTIGGIVGAAPYVAPAAALFGHVGGVVSPLVAMLTSASHDPDLLRAVAGKRVPMTSGDLAAQMRLHAALGTRPNTVSPMEALRYGAGQAANAAEGVLPALMRHLPGVR